jgi:Domain of unknown function (DUF5753)
MVPGLVQTPPYAREVLALASPGGDPAQVERRLEAQDNRQNKILYDPQKRIQLLIGEAALRVWFGNPATLAGQLDRLATVAAFGNVDIGILPFDQPQPLLPLSGFAVNDHTVAWVETLVGEQRLDDPIQVRQLADAFDTALAAAVTGEAAVVLIRSTA